MGIGLMILKRFATGVALLPFAIALISPVYPTGSALAVPKQTSAVFPHDTSLGIVERTRNSPVSPCVLVDPRSSGHPPCRLSPDGGRTSSRVLDQDLVPSPEVFGAKGDGVTDDTAAVNRFIAYVGSNGIAQLSCNRSYFFGGRVDLGNDTILRHCSRLPAVVYDESPIGFPGSVLTAPHIALGPHATFNMYRGAGLENAVVIASSIDSLKLPDASTFAGTAITQAAGGLGSAIHVSNVMMLGFLQCFDGSNGGATIDFRNLVGDCVKGFDFGTSQGTSFIDAIKLGPYLTAGFSGYRILSVIGDGKTVKIGYIGPKIRVGDRISLRGVSIPNVNDETPYKVTSSSGSASKSDLSTATFASAGLNGPGLVRGTAQYYDAQYLRQGGTYGFKFSNRSDDSHFGSLGDFGHDISLEASSAGFLSGDHLWCDNNAVACIKNVGHFDLQIGGVTAANTRNAYLSAGGSQPVVSAIGRLVARSTYEDCIVVNSGVLFVAYLDCGQVGVSEGGYAINIGDPTAYVTIAGGSFSQLSTGAIASAAPPDHLSINVKWIDAAPGASLYTGGSMKITSIASAATLRLLPTSSMSEVTGTNTISSISGAWAGREYLFVCTEACVFSGKGGIRGFTITLKRGLTKLTGPGAFRFVYSTAGTGTWEQE